MRGGRERYGVGGELKFEAEPLLLKPSFFFFFFGDLNSMTSGGRKP